MDAKDGIWNYELAFPSDMDKAHTLIDKVMRQLDGTDWTGKEQFAINLALEEGLVNAVQHGNHSNPAKMVHFSCRLTNDCFYCRIEDEGEGFDPEKVPDPTDEDHIMIASGRGVLLIRNFVNRAQWNERGTMWGKLTNQERNLIIGSA